MNFEDGNDKTTNVYFINGIVESVQNAMKQSKNVKVVVYYDGYEDSHELKRGESGY